MKLLRLDHFGIEVAELERAERFYTDVLGLEVVARFGDQVLLQCGEQNLALFRIARTPLDANERARTIAHPLGKGHH
ncbi:MAG: VOC family protein, partial [Candidatus Binataceae bacterium]